MNRDEFYTAFKHDIITSKLKPGELLKEKQKKKLIILLKKLEKIEKIF